MPDGSGFQDAKAVPGVLAGPEIDHYHQAIALVVAETFAQARAAAGLVRIEYVRSQGTFDLVAARMAQSNLKSSWLDHRILR